MPQSSCFKYLIFLLLLTICCRNTTKNSISSEIEQSVLNNLNSCIMSDQLKKEIVMFNDTLEMKADNLNKGKTDYVLTITFDKRENDTIISISSSKYIGTFLNEEYTIMGICYFDSTKIAIQNTISESFNLKNIFYDRECLSQDSLFFKFNREMSPFVELNIPGSKQWRYKVSGKKMEIIRKF